MIVTIDGPAASGKSTVSRIVAQKLGFYYLNSGSLYRSLGYLLVNKRGYTLDTIGSPSLEDVYYCLDLNFFSYRYDEQRAQESVFFLNENITPYLKDSFIDKITSILSVNENVRNAITTIQHSIAASHNVVADGRDVGSVVFPFAEFKFFLIASVKVRAERWRKDQEKYDNFLSIDKAIELINDRDNRDIHRSIAPLIIPHNAHVIDSSELNIDETVEKIITIIHARSDVSTDSALNTSP